MNWQFNLLRRRIHRNPWEESLRALSLLLVFAAFVFSFQQATRIIGGVFRLQQEARGQVAALELPDRQTLDALGRRVELFRELSRRLDFSFYSLLGALEQCLPDGIVVQKIAFSQGKPSADGGPGGSLSGHAAGMDRALLFLHALAAHSDFRQVVPQKLGQENGRTVFEIGFQYGPRH